MNVDNFDFVGTCWPKARFENGHLVAGGKKRIWWSSVATPRWWDLAGVVSGGLIDLQGAHALERTLAFVRRSGLPGGYNLDHGPVAFALDGSTPASNTFIQLAHYLNFMTRFWQPPDENGHASFRRIVHRHSPLAEMMGNALNPVPKTRVGQLVFGLQGQSGDPTVWIDCDSLDDYLPASMAIHVATKQTLAICLWCGSCYAPRRPKRSRYCSSSCRSAAAKSVKAVKAAEAAKAEITSHIPTK